MRLGVAGVRTAGQQVVAKNVPLTFRRTELTALPDDHAALVTVTCIYYLESRRSLVKHCNPHQPPEL